MSLKIIWDNVRKMLVMRGCLEKDIPQFAKYYFDGKPLIVFSAGRDKYYNVFFVNILQNTHKGLNKDGYRKISALFSQDPHEKKSMVIIYDEKVTKDVLRIEQTDPQLQIFHVDRFRFDFLGHSTMPESIILYRRGTKEYEKLFNGDKVFSPDTFPLINHDDPVSRFLDAECGDIIKTVNTHINSGIYVEYMKIVMEPSDNFKTT